MINRHIENDTKKYITNNNLVVNKTKDSIDVYIAKPIFEDIGTFIYKNVNDRDNDYNEIMELINLFM